MSKEPRFKATSNIKYYKRIKAGNKSNIEYIEANKGVPGPGAYEADPIRIKGAPNSTQLLSRKLMSKTMKCKGRFINAIMSDTPGPGYYNTEKVKTTTAETVEKKESIQAVIDKLFTRPDNTTNYKTCSTLKNRLQSLRPLKKAGTKASTISERLRNYIIQNTTKKQPKKKCILPGISEKANLLIGARKNSLFKISLIKSSKADIMYILTKK